MINFLKKSNQLSTLILLFMVLGTFSCTSIQTVFIATRAGIEKGLQSEDPRIKAQAEELKIRFDSTGTCPEGQDAVGCPSNGGVIWYTDYGKRDCGCVSPRQGQGGGAISLDHDPNCVECPGGGCCLAVFKNTHYQIFQSESLILRESDNEDNSKQHNFGDSPEDKKLDNGFTLLKPNTLSLDFSNIDQLIIDDQIVPVAPTNENH